MNLKGIFSNKSESTKLFLFVMIVFISALIGILSIGIISADAGDTENIPEMKSLKNIDVAFLPMNRPTMTPEMVADAARAFKPKILYPYHYGDTEINLLVKLLSDTNIPIRIRNLK